jgi:glycine C-acetyltransferase
MDPAFYEHLARETAALKDAGLYKEERVIASPQEPGIEVLDAEDAEGAEGRRQVINFCANNYLGLSDHPALVEAARAALSRYGYGMSSVRFICGTQTVHKELEARLSAFLGTADTILYSSCFDANTGLFETILGEQDAVISDALNHASIIDGVRLCKARRLRYANNDMADLEDKLKFPWTASSPTCRPSAIWPSATGRWSWLTIPTPSASWARAAGARPSITASPTGSTS